MWKNIGSDKCFSFVKAQFYPDRQRYFFQPEIIKPTITVSRMAGAGGHTIASDLAEYLQTHSSSHATWTIFDRNLVEKVLEDHHLQKYIAEFMREGHKSMFTDILEELLGLHPSSWTLVHQTSATISHLADAGNVIIVGRGASIIANRVPHVFHVRLVGSLEKRTERVQYVHDFDRRSALHFIKREDEGRRRYLKDNFDRDIDDPLLYHMILNTDLTGYDNTARLIGEEVIKRFKLDKARQARPNELRVATAI